MPIQTYVENGCLVGALPGIGEVRVPLSEIIEAAGVSLTQEEADELDGIPGGSTIVGAIEAYESTAEVGAGKIAKRIKKKLKKAMKAIKKVAKSKLIKGLVNFVKKAVPPPFNVAITAAEGAAKFAKSLKKKGSKHKKLVPAIQAAAAGKITPAELTARAKKLGVNPNEAADAAVIKRVALQARSDPQAAATLKLAVDMTSTEPVQQQLALAAAAQAQGGPGTRAFVVQAPGGQTYRTMVQTGT